MEQTSQPATAANVIIDRLPVDGKLSSHFPVSHLHVFNPRQSHWERSCRLCRINCLA